jgi:hypothetical protein
MSGNKYRAVFTNQFGSANATAAAVQVIAASRPTITKQPMSQAVPNGLTATFTAVASGSGTPTPTVQWQGSTNGRETFTDVSRATSTTLTLTTAYAMNDNLYRAVFTNQAGRPGQTRRG